MASPTRRRLRVLASAVAAVALIAPQTASAATANPRAKGCDRLDDAACMLPFPNDAFTTPSASWSGRRLHFATRMMPRNRRGKPISAAPFRTFDGFSPDSVILTRVPGLDTARALRRTNPVRLADISRYTARNAPVIVFDARTRKRFPIWVGLDMGPRRARERLLEIHPAKNLQEGHRYVVVLRNLRTARGRRIAAGRRFAALRDGRRRTTRYASIFRAMRRAGIARNRRVFLAWDFTVASERSVTGRLQTMRDEAFAQLGDTDLADGRIVGAPPEHTLAPLALTGADTQYAGRFAQVLEGTVTVPCYLDTPGCAPGGAFHYARAGDFLPAQRPGNVIRARFTCVVPASASPATPARLVLYGHDRGGSDRDVLTSPLTAALAAEENLVLCATPLLGVADADAGTGTTASGDLSRLPAVADALQQGVLDLLVLGRLMAHPAGLAASPLLQVGGSPIVEPGRVYLVGVGQGASTGGVAAAFAPDLVRAVLDAPAATSTPPDARAFAAAYRNPLERRLGVELARILTDRGEARGVAGHLSVNPPPGTPQHQVLLHALLADPASAPYETDAIARTIGARVHQPAFGAGRAPQRRPLWGLRALPEAPWAGSALVYWDAAAQPAPAALATRAARAQASAFLAPQGRVVDACGRRPCVAAAPAG